MDSGAALQRIKSFFRIGRKRRFERGEVIVQAEEEPVNAYWIESGYVKVVSYSLKGRQRVHFFFGPGEVIPISRLFGYFMTKMSFIAATDVVTKTRSVTDFRKFAEKDSQLLLAILHTMLQTIDRIYCLHLEKSEDRLIHTLLVFCRRFGTRESGGEHTTLDLPLTQQEMADLTRTSRESVSKILNKLEDEGCMVVGRKHMVINTGELEARLLRV